MQFAMFTGKLHIYHFYYVRISYNNSLKYYVQVCKSFSFWGHRPPDPPPGLYPWTPLGTFVPKPPDWPLFILGLSGGIPPPKKKSEIFSPPKKKTNS